MNKEIRYHYEENRPVAGFEHLIGHMVLKGEMSLTEALQALEYHYNYQEPDYGSMGERPDLPPDFRR